MSFSNFKISKFENLKILKIQFFKISKFQDTLFGHVPDKFGGQKWSFSKKFWGCLGYHLASSEVSETRSKNLFKNIFSKKNKSCADFFLYILAPELNSDLFSRAVLCIFSFFHIFHFSPLAGSYIPLLGP